MDPRHRPAADHGSHAHAHARAGRPARAHAGAGRRARLRARLRLGVVLLATALMLGLPARALALSPSLDPAHNIAPDQPASCGQRGGGPCAQAGVSALDASRSALGLPGYVLPDDFARLTSDEQMFVLTDLDRILYGLPPIPGISARLSQAAAVGVARDADPTIPLGPGEGFAANWAGGEPDALWAYQAWMYDDGPGSFNIDCPAAGSAGCWGHRHDILVRFPAGAALAAGFATGVDSRGRSGEAMIIASVPRAAAPRYLFTWRQAVRAGAGTRRARPGGVRPGPPPRRSGVA